jgi:SAM-dependent methyltransferase
VSFTKDGHRYRVCVCGLASLDPPPSEDAARAFYGESYFRGEAAGGYLDYEADEGAHRANARARLAALRRAGLERGRVLDVGCAVGFFLDEARAAGFAGSGVEVSPWARARARERFGLEVAPDLEEVAASVPGSFDAVSVAQVLEHSARPDRLLRAVARALAPGGLLFVETWDRGSLVARLVGLRWQQISPPSVVHLFDRGSLRALLARTGFGGVSMRRGGKAVSVGFVGHLLGQKYGAVGRLLARASGHEAVRGRTLRYALGDLIEVTARRAGGA